jgi:hypothetical protein
MTHYFLKCQYKENYDDDVHTYTFKGDCLTTGRKVSVVLLGPDLFKYNQGENIQDAFPYIHAEFREWMMTGHLGMNEW